ncbi:hypothetical protein H2198_003018 [Neophaeococcomyces mojaviensis]|uniref:Uncharacterized protein n=1 Tax=Neophaeococcomyces mojaviensis TaxID=3383035 RepID=A0ACC3AD47_9EURO|nr:hypothetical protein H2198_003018 [Knufia sp. JES_112]
MYREGDLFWMCKVAGCYSHQKRWPRLDNFKAHMLRMHGLHQASEITRACHVFRQRFVPELPPRHPIDHDDSGISVQSEASCKSIDLTVDGNLSQDVCCKNTTPGVYGEMSSEGMVAPDQNQVAQANDIDKEETFDIPPHAKSMPPESRQLVLPRFAVLRYLSNRQSAREAGLSGSARGQLRQQPVQTLACGISTSHPQAEPVALASLSSGTVKSYTVEEHGTQASSESRGSASSRASHKSNQSAECTPYSYNDKEEDDCDGTVPQQSTLRKREHEVHRPFACPYWKARCSKYLSQSLESPQGSCCGIHDLQDIAAVKKHLSRNHSKPKYYCDTCYEVFPSGQNKEIHELQRLCSPGASQFNDKMSDEAYDKVQCKHQGSAEEAWYSIFEILFPNEQRPVSPYANDSDMRIHHQLSIFRALGPQLTRSFYDTLNATVDSAESIEVAEIVREAFCIFAGGITEQINDPLLSLDARQPTATRFNITTEQSLPLNDSASILQADLAAVGMAFPIEYSRKSSYAEHNDSGIGSSIGGSDVLLEPNNQVEQGPWSPSPSCRVLPSPASLGATDEPDLDGGTLVEDRCSSYAKALLCSTSPLSGDQAKSASDCRQERSQGVISEQDGPPALSDANISRAAEIFAQIVLSLHAQAYREGSLPLILCPSDGGEVYTNTEPQSGDCHRTSQASANRQNHENGKRKSKQTPEPGEQGSDSEAVLRQSKKQKLQPQKEKFLACPFNKKDPERYSERNFNVLEEAFRNCGTCKLRDISAVKQHIERKHYRPPHYCGVCYASFKEAAANEAHQVERRCTLATKSPFSDCPEKTATDKIANVRQKNGNCSQAWYEIWAILFPNIEKPRSPYATDVNELLVRHSQIIFQRLGRFAHVIYRELCRQDNSQNNLPPADLQVVEEAYRRVRDRLIAPPVAYAQTASFSNQLGHNVSAVQTSANMQQPGHLDDSMNYLGPTSFTADTATSSGQDSQMVSTWRTPSLVSYPSNTPMTQNNDIPSDLFPPEYYDSTIGMDLVGMTSAPTIDFGQMDNTEDPAAMAGSTFPYGNAYQDFDALNSNGTIRLHQNINVAQRKGSNQQTERGDDNLSGCARSR